MCPSVYKVNKEQWVIKDIKDIQETAMLLRIHQMHQNRQ